MDSWNASYMNVIMDPAIKDKIEAIIASEKGLPR